MGPHPVMRIQVFNSDVPDGARFAGVIDYAGTGEQFEVWEFPGDRATLWVRRRPQLVCDQLAPFSTAQLLDELKLRMTRASDDDDDSPRNPDCESCVQFRVWRGHGDPPATYNPCAKRHKMHFRMPRNSYPHDERIGYTRPGCTDFAPVPEPGTVPPEFPSKPRAE